MHKYEFWKLENHGKYVTFHNYLLKQRYDKTENQSSMNKFAMFIDNNITKKTERDCEFIKILLKSPDEYAGIL